MARTAERRWIEILFDLLCDPGWYGPTNLMSRMNGKKTHTHTHPTVVQLVISTPSDFGM